jgi:hypothetical protein
MSVPHLGTVVAKARQWMGKRLGEKWLLVKRRGRLRLAERLRCARQNREMRKPTLPAATASSVCVRTGACSPTHTAFQAVDPVTPHSSRSH